MFQTANAPSTSAAVPIALGDGGRCGGQNSSSSSMNSVGSKVVVIVIEGVRADVERLLVLLRLIQLLDDLAPHRSPAQQHLTADESGPAGPSSLNDSLSVSPSRGRTAAFSAARKPVFTLTSVRSSTRVS